MGQFSVISGSPGYGISRQPQGIILNSPGSKAVRMLCEGVGKVELVHSLWISAEKGSLIEQKMHPS